MFLPPGKMSCMCNAKDSGATWTFLGSNRAIWADSSGPCTSWACSSAYLSARFARTACLAAGRWLIPDSPTAGRPMAIS